ncbi:CRISPR-associated helicase/endonuclease Cas3 [Fusobacterium animalis]|uniref:CRISPR-associated helicase cas3 n=2 Tax=Fusobacterium animalis TaxID=76859 RepID=A0A140PWQ2_9FUSO|nr:MULTISPECIES: CRISPR-associated helicase/endonuclease Cas3 [Fusobacterium]ASG30479.1 CRISPR-associated helicase/endonuclease Cas3 [Fusobacterium animalis]EEO43828.2 CRISPR-associated helicase cas3 [Fusobacterium animalis 7_1]EPC07706.1 CRISPR-associated helicase cas3 [Fusobacterium polymorphum F0401]BEO90779.1 CRISPR-associated helicase/endonuclease Cas3 [Fusobacterium nucleatum]BEP00705.1 CRISPR-associated helicase/endonuclease Cas3 [Fusobacterium nucleatum]
MTKFEDIFSFQDKYKYLAHIKDNRKETLQEHTELANKYFEKIVEYKNLKPFFERIKNILNLKNQEEELYYKMIDDVVNFHDFGKVNSQFQIDKMLNEEILKMEDKYNISGVLGSDHSLLSASMFIAYYFGKITDLIEMVETKKIVILLEILFALSYTISKHHGNLDSFEEYIEKLSRNNDENILKELKNISVSNGGILLRAFLEKENITIFFNFIETYISERKKKENISSQEAMSIFVFTKMMFSLLVASDYYSTNEFMQEIKYEDFGNMGNIDTIKKEYENSEIIKSIRDKEKNGIANDEDINNFRTKIFLEAEKNLEKNKEDNIFFLEAPTGSGKSNTALNLSLKLLDKDRRKIFYVYPFNTLVEQNMNTLKNIFGNNKEVIKNIAVVNSVTALTNKDSRDIPIEEYSDILMDRQFLNYPFIVTTHVGIFNSLVGNTKEDCMPFYQLANSVIVFDEIQAYKNTIWTEIIKILNSYAKLLNIKIIIMSATLPNLSYLLDEEEKNNISKLIENRDEYFNNTIFKNRVEVNYDLLSEQKIEYEELLKHITENSLNSQKILIEFISKNDAKKFYELCENNEDLNVDHEILILTGEDNKARRNFIIKKINSKDKKIILISTQLIEAGVDIDVDVGYKNISGLDNEEQFLGRINRSCKKSGKAYFFYLTDAKKVYKNSVIIENKLNLFSDEMRDVLENKNFDVFYSKVLEILKRKAKEKNNNDNFETIIFNKKFRLLKERMKLIEEQEDKKTYFFNRTLTDEEIEEIGENIDGSEVWERYVNILKEENYAKKIVELSKIREKMMYFLYEVKKNTELNYSDIKGSIIYIDDGDKYFTDGIYTGGEGDMFI